MLLNTAMSWLLQLNIQRSLVGLGGGKFYKNSDLQGYTQKGVQLCLKVAFHCTFTAFPDICTPQVVYKMCIPRGYLGIRNTYFSTNVIYDKLWCRPNNESEVHFHRFLTTLLK